MFLYIDCNIKIWEKLVLSTKYYKEYSTFNAPIWRYTIYKITKAYKNHENQRQKTETINPLPFLQFYETDRTSRAAFERSNC